MLTPKLIAINKILSLIKRNSFWPKVGSVKVSSALFNEADYQHDNSCNQRNCAYDSAKAFISHEKKHEQEHYLPKPRKYEPYRQERPLIYPQNLQQEEQQPFLSI